MSFNKAREERKWRIWKEAEEKQMRQLGVSENAIEKLRVDDWVIFNSDRRYYEKLQEAGIYLDEVAESEQHTEIVSVENFLDSIESEKLHQVLITVDKLTLRIVVMKIQGYSTCEIASCLNATKKSVYRRIDRFKEKIKKVF